MSDSLIPATPPAATSPRPRNRAARAIARGILVVLFLAGMFLSLFPLGRAVTRAGILLPSLIDASQFADLAAGGEPIRHVAIRHQATDGSDIFFDIYEPSTPPPPVPGTREAVVMIPGVGDNRQEPQLINLARSFAHAGLVVLNLTTTALIKLTLAKQDAAAVVDGVTTLANWPGVDRRHIGVIGFSAGDGLAILAAADPRIRDQLAFVTSFGGYYDAADFLGVLGRRSQMVDGRAEPWIPQPLYVGAPAIQSVPLQVLSNTVAPLLPGPDGATVAAAFRDGIPLTPEADAALAPVARAVYHLLLGDTPDQTAAHLAALSPAINDLLQSVSPRSVIDQVHTTIYLLHDRSDRYVPFTESRHFAQAYRGPHDVVEFSIFQHVEVKSGLGIGPLIGDGSRLFRVLVAILNVAG